MYIFIYLYVYIHTYVYMMSIMIDDVQLTSNVINAAAACAQAANKVALPFFDSTLAAEDLGGIPVASMEIR